MIGFPRGAAPALVERYVEATGVQAVGLGTGCVAGARAAAAGRRWRSRARWIRQLLRAGGPALDDADRRSCCEQWSRRPYIFNLGHGVLPDTPIEHIGQVVEQRDRAGARLRREPADRGRPVQPRRPGRPAAVRPFLSNLFSDPAIIGAPAAGALAAGRADLAGCASRPRSANYAVMGGASPLNAETRRRRGRWRPALRRGMPG